MPDRRKHRGPHPDDHRLFASGQLPRLQAAVAEFSWLLTRGYAEFSALKLVGDRHGLTARQRLAVRRSSCSDQSFRSRMERLAALEQARGVALAVDGYNLLITVEAALSGGVVLIGRDGCYRDLAGIHGTYRRVEETIPALLRFAETIASIGAARIDWYLDKPVSNSGRLKKLMAETLRVGGASAPCEPVTWNIELVAKPDAVLIDHKGLVASSDSVVLDRTGHWVNLAAAIVTRFVPDAWRLNLGGWPNGPDGLLCPPLGFEAD